MSSSPANGSGVRGTKLDVELKAEESNVPLSDGARFANDEPLKAKSKSLWKELGIEDTSKRESQNSTTENPDGDYVDFETLDQVRVICRFRPVNGREKREEKQAGLEQKYPVIQGTKLTLNRSQNKKNTRSKNAGLKTYNLDKTLDWECSQNRAFRTIGLPMVEAVLGGYNATIFAYGQTGSGKTYTMFGPEGNVYSPRHLGIIQRAMSLLFGSLQKRKDGRHPERSIERFTVTIQYVQIYSEKIIDLLDPKAGCDLKIRFKPGTDEPYVENVTKKVVHETRDVLKLTKIAIDNRIVDNTQMNASSSRSHLVMTIEVEQIKQNGTQVFAKLNFGDLAGSESIRKTNVKVGSKQFKELRAINLSLTNLTSVINDIVEGRHPTFRNSKLTYLLQDSLGGNTKTTIIVCASPHIFNRDETIRTLNFAQAAKTIKNKAQVNEVLTFEQVMKSLKIMEAENQKLKTTVAKLEGQLKLGNYSGDSGKITNNKEYTELMSQVTELESQMESNATKEKKEFERLKDQLRLKSIDLDSTMLQLQTVQQESHGAEVKAEQLKKKSDELGIQVEQMKTRLETVESLRIRANQEVEGLRDKLQDEEVLVQSQKELIAEFGTKLEISAEDMASKDIRIEDLKQKNSGLRKLLVKESQRRSKVEKSKDDLKSQMVELNTQLNKNEEQKAGLSKEKEELLKELHDKKENELRSLTAEELLEKHQLDENKIRGIEADLSRVLASWHNRGSRKKRKSKVENPNTSISFQVRHVIAFFGIAMNRMTELEEQRRMSNMKRSDLRHMEKEMQKLRKTISSFEKQVTELKSDKVKLVDEIESLRQINSQKNPNDVADKNLDRTVEYLDTFTNHTLHGQLQDLMDIDSVTDPLSESDEDEEAHAAMAMMLGRSRVSVSEGGWRRALKAGDMVDCLDRDDLWYSATVMDVKTDEDGDQLLIHYSGFDNKYDEWILRFDPRIAQEGEKAAGGKESGGILAYEYEVIGKKDGKNIVKEGYMMLGSAGRLRRTKFKSRHFVLFEEGLLKYYINRSAQQPLGAINLCLIKWIQMEKALYTKKLFQFSLQEMHKQWMLKVGSHEDMNHWIQVLKKIRLRVIDTYSLKFLNTQNMRQLSSPESRLRSRSFLKRELGDVKTEGQDKELLPIYLGMVWKLGRSVRNWKKRFFVLYDNHSIFYFEREVNPHKPKIKQKGTIDIWGIAGMRQMNKEDIEAVKLPKECVAGMILDTNERQWFLGFEKMEDLVEWKTKIVEHGIFVGSDADSRASRKRWSLTSFKSSFGGMVSKGFSYNSKSLPSSANVSPRSATTNSLSVEPYIALASRRSSCEDVLSGFMLPITDSGIQLPSAERDEQDVIDVCEGSDTFSSC